jgi:hypothetical protein
MLGIMLGIFNAKKQPLQNPITTLLNKQTAKKKSLKHP